MASWWHPSAPHPPRPLQAVDDLKRAMEVDASFGPTARPMLRRLEPRLAQENEKMKDEDKQGGGGAE